MTGKLSIKTLSGSTGKNTTKTFDGIDAGLSNIKLASFADAYNDLLETGTALVKGTYTQYTETEVTFN